MCYWTAVSVKVKVNVPVHAMNAYNGIKTIVLYDMIWYIC